MGKTPKRLSADEQVALWTAVVGRWTRALVIVTVFTGIILALQLWVLEKADDTSRATNRSYVFLQGISLTGLENGDWAVVPQWSNGGNISTETLKARINLIGLDSEDGARTGFSRCNVANAPSAPMVLGPKQTSDISFFEAKASAFADFQHGSTKKIYIWGWARYSDGFSEKPRTTRFCFDVTRVLGNPGDTKGKLEVLHTLCKESNCTDGQCEKENAALPKAVCDAPRFELDRAE